MKLNLSIKVFAALSILVSIFVLGRSMYNVLLIGFEYGDYVYVLISNLATSFISTIMWGALMAMVILEKEKRIYFLYLGIVSVILAVINSIMFFLVYDFHGILFFNILPSLFLVVVYFLWYKNRTQVALIMYCVYLLYSVFNMMQHMFMGGFFSLILSSMTYVVIILLLVRSLKEEKNSDLMTFEYEELDEYEL